MKLIFSALIILSFSIACLAQNDDLQYNPKLINWYLQEYQKGGIAGTNVEKAYQWLNEHHKKPSKKVIVAIMDSGVDIDNDELKDKIWTNKDEIPDNGIDDDKNGYIDDIHGWNYIGNSEGKNINYENFEYTRVYKQKDTSNPFYDEAAELYAEELAKQQTIKQNLAKFEDNYQTSKEVIKRYCGRDVNSFEEAKKIIPLNEGVDNAREFLMYLYRSGFKDEMYLQLKKNNKEYLEYFLNKDFNPRAIIGDDPEDIEDANYGNADVEGNRADHGTAVAGVIAANRQNNAGIKGIADNVELMILRTTPHGDERDKDVALAIRYAVYNGADIINMSFGKTISPQKSFVDDAVRYAEEKGVLIVHSAGNDGKNIDYTPSFPSDQYLNGREPRNWINVGASARIHNKTLAAKFSNYGNGHVDLFAPGVDIVCLDTANNYTQQDGTSLSGPVVTGIAALVLSYYPDLSAEQLADILKKSVTKIKHPQKVYKPNLTGKKNTKIRFDELCKSGGIVDAYHAILMAEQSTTTP